MISRELVARVLETFKTAADAHYFFENLESAEWIKPLYEEGLFRDPTTLNEQGDFAYYPLWAPSRYLARVADQAPEAVRDVIREIRDNGNPRVYEDLVDAALKMPPEVAVDLLPRTLVWARTEYQMLLAEKLAQLAAKLAVGGFLKEALELLKELLIILPDPRGEEIDEENRSGFVPRPRPRIDEWRYKEIVKKYLPHVVELTEMKGIDLVCDLLDSYVMHLRQDSPQVGNQDLSFIWRPAIEDHDQNRNYNFENILVEAVRDGTQQLLSAKPELTGEVIRVLESKPWEVFHRIALHIMRKTPDLVIGEIAQRLANKHLCDSVGLFHEFWLLAGEQFANSTSETQSTVLHNIESGPPQDLVCKLEDPEHIVKYWKLRRLEMIGDNLPEPWKAEYENLREQFGEREQPGFLTYTSGVMTGPDSPLSNDDLANMHPGDIAGWLLTWEPSGEFMAPSPEGLSRQLQSVVSEKPGLFAESIDEFKGQQPPYVRGLIDGFRKACADGTAFEWSRVLELCQWVMSQPRDADKDSPDSFDTETNWLPTRRSIARLLEEGFSSTSCGIDLSLRTIAWSVLEPLTQDPEPNQEHEVMGSGFLGDPATSSINMVRGLAMHATVRYALWVKRLSDDSAWRGFDGIPEVLAVLEDHLNIAAEATRTVRAVYGQWFPWIVFLDLEWAKNNVSSIFPDGEELERLRDAAWNTYLTVSRAYDNNTFDLLRTQYLQAIDRIEPLDPEGYPYDHPDKRLAEHLMVFFWRAKIEFGDFDQLIERFFEKATDDLKGKALGFVGRTAENYDGQIPDDTVRRLTALWESRMSSISVSGELDNHNKELSSFGWWFMSSQFEDGWSIDQLLGVLQAIKNIEADGHVVQRLAELSGSHPFKTVHALRLMTEGDEHGWGMGLWREDSRVVLENALCSSDNSAKTEAANLIHYMASKNDRQFVDLLTQSS